jgi:hypothetical protein
MLKTTTLLVGVALLAVTLVFGIEGQRRYESAQQRTASHTVDVVGDSLSWQSETSIQSTLAEAGYTASVAANPGHSLVTTWAQRQLRSDLSDESAGVIVVETASNDAARLSEGTLSLSAYRQLLDDLIGSASGRCVVIVDAKVSVTPAYYSSASATLIDGVITNTASSHSNVRVVQWSRDVLGHDSWFGPDLLHFAPGLPATLTAADQPTAAAQNAGEKAFAAAIAAGVRSCG